MILGYIVSQYSLSFFSAHRGLFFLLISAVIAAAALSGIGSYTMQGRKLDKSLDELSSLITQMKTREQVQGPITVDMLSLVEKILTLLPEVVRKRNQDSFLFGILAFVVTLLPARLPLAILIGVLVWLYFRYEMNKGYDKEIARFEEQKNLFERRKSEFMATL